jgi:gliding motility-associated-like protein
MKFIKILICFLLVSNFGISQSIKRQALSGNTMISSKPLFRISQTAAGCPGCDVLKGTNSNYLRQGYQQPPNIENNTNNINCVLKSSFTFAKDTSTSCGEVYNFTFNGVNDANTSVEWNFGPDANNEFSSDKEPIGIGFFNLTPKVITLKISNGSCTSTASKILFPTQVAKGAKANITKAKCFNDQNGAIKLTLSSYNVLPTFNWSNGKTTQDIDKLKAGTYTCNLTDNSGCNITVSAKVGQPDSAISIKSTLLNEVCDTTRNGSIVVNVSGGTKPYTYKWSTGTGSSSVVGLTKGGYTLKVTDANLCPFDTSFVINTLCKGDNFPNIFTPNGDGYNNLWEVTGIEKFPDNQTEIFNRWGSLVYSRKGWDGKWDGKNDNGEELESATYYYIINLNNAAKDIWHGYVTLIR